MKTNKTRIFLFNISNELYSYNHYLDATGVRPLLRSSEEGAEGKDKSIKRKEVEGMRDMEIDMFVLLQIIISALMVRGKANFRKDIPSTRT